MKPTHTPQSPRSVIQKKRGYRWPLVFLIGGTIGLAYLLFEAYQIFNVSLSDKDGMVGLTGLVIIFEIMLICTIPVAIIIIAGVILIKRWLQNKMTVNV